MRLRTRLYLISGCHLLKPLRTLLPFYSSLAVRIACRGAYPTEESHIKGSDLARPDPRLTCSDAEDCWWDLLPKIGTTFKCNRLCRIRRAQPRLPSLGCLALSFPDFPDIIRAERVPGKAARWLFIVLGRCRNNFKLRNMKHHVSPAP